LLLTLIDRINDFKRVVCRFGARTPEDFIYKDTLFGQWQNIDGLEIKLTVDKANGQWKDNIGVVTTILRPEDVNIQNAVAIVCGPPIMMKFASLDLVKKGFRLEDIYLSMEKNMSCGIGKCGHCMLGKYYVCKDGPVFTFDQVKDYPDIWA
jgi:NAD(P)H-flavin reductase